MQLGPKFALPGTGVVSQVAIFGASMNGLLQDVRYDLRQLCKTPGFTGVALITLALGIGATTAMFSVIDGVLIRPLPFKAPSRLYTVWERNPKMGYEEILPAAANFRDWRERNQAFEQLAAFDAAESFDLSGDSKPERVDGAAVSPGLFELLGVSPLIGHTFEANEDRWARNACFSWAMDSGSVVSMRTAPC